VAVSSSGIYANHFITYTLLKTENHASISSIFTGWLLFLMSNLQCWSIEEAKS